MIFLFTLSELTALFGDTADLRLRDINIGGNAGRKITALYLEGMISSRDAAELILSPASDARRFPETAPAAVCMRLMAEGAVFSAEVKERDEAEKAAEDMLSGSVILYFPTEKRALSFEARSTCRRTAEKPQDEKVLKGAKEAFCETLQINAALVRRRIRDPRLRFAEITLGSRAPTTVFVAYIEGFTPRKLVREAIHRLENLRCEGVITSSVIEEGVADCVSSPLPQMIVTERADKFCLNLLEGRVGILCDGLPVGYLAPGTLAQFMKAPEDEATHFIHASFQTVFRHLAALIALLAPAIYTALALYHQELIPLRILQSMIEAEVEVPFPTAAEVFIMLLALDLLEEAGIRMPSPIGPTVSIIGALIIGQSAVEARIVSPVIVVVTALAGTAEYAVPNRDMQLAIKLGRLGLTVLAALFGLYGIAFGVFLIILHLISLKSFGYSYLTGLARYPGRALLRYPMTVKKEEDPTLR